MRVILLQDIKGTGKKGDVIEVKDGYGRNFLLPRGLADEATLARERAVAEKKNREQARAEKERTQMSDLALALKGRTVNVPARAGEGGRLFGAVTNTDVARALQQEGFVVDRKKITLEPLKHIGQAEAKIHLYPGIETIITVQVVPE
ncbi:MAG: 50S ribosomal protein L9 [Sulfobacillus sp.]